MLSQLSYSPKTLWLQYSSVSTSTERLAERTGLEPATPCVTGRYSNQLNYRSALWWAKRGSNPRPSACKADALPTELFAQNAVALIQFCQHFDRKVGGTDGTRTRDPLRDRQ